MRASWHGGRPSSHTRRPAGSVLVPTDHTRPMRKRHRLNVVGAFYVEDGGCIACGAPEAEAPELMGWTDDPGHHCYFKKQPANAEEVDHAIRALEVSCCGALRYGGDDPAIIARLEPGLVDHASPEKTPLAVEPVRTPSGRWIVAALLLLVVLAAAVVLESR